MHRDGSIEAHVSTVAGKHAADPCCRPAFVLREKDFGKSARLQNAHAAMTLAAEGASKKLFFGRVVHINSMLIVKHKLYGAKHVLRPWRLREAEGVDIDTVLVN